MNSLSIIILAYNEEQLLEQTVQKTVEVLEEIAVPYEVIIVDDGSTDRTGAIIEQLVKDNGPIKSVVHTKNQGMGKSIKDGYTRAKNEFVCFLPGDGQIPPRVLIDLYQATQNVDFVTVLYASRDDNVLRKIMSKTFKVILRVFFGRFPRLDGVYMFRRKILNKITLISKTFVLNFEFIIKAHRKGYRSSQITINCLRREQGGSKVANPKRILSVLREIVILRTKLKD